MRVLVCYATAHESTAEIAQRIAARLRKSGVAKRVDLSSVDRARSAIEYDAVVLGSAIHDGAWLPEARAFVFDNARALASRPHWLFSVGMVAALPRRLRAMAAKEGPKVIAALPASLDPKSTRLFSGVVRADHLSRLGRAIFRLVGAEYGDYRDWSAIDGWADEIAAELGTLETETWLTEPELSSELVGLA